MSETRWYKPSQASLTHTNPLNTPLKSASHHQGPPHPSLGNTPRGRRTKVPRPQLSSGTAALTLHFHPLPAVSPKETQEGLGSISLGGVPISFWKFSSLLSALALHSAGSPLNLWLHTLPPMKAPLYSRTTSPWLDCRYVQTCLQAVPLPSGQPGGSSANPGWVTPTRP